MGKKTGALLTSSISRWLWSGKNKQEAVVDKSPVSVKAVSSSTMSKGTVMDFNSKGGDMKVDREYDAVLVPSCGDDDVSESDELDWSIGWLESFSPEFQSDDDNDSSYAVLVPSYRPGCIDGSKGLKTVPGNGIRGGSCDYTAEGKKYMEQWLSSLQGR